MKRLLVIAVVLFGFALSQQAVRESAAPLEGALESMENTHYTIAYLPGYGLQLSGIWVGYESPSTPEIVDFLVKQTTALAPTIRGLKEGEWVSVTFAFYPSEDRVQEVTVRTKPDSSALEVWVDGELQP